MICIKCWVKLEYFSMETIRMIQKAAATGSWWLAVSSGQHPCSCITSLAEFWGANILSIRWLNAPCSPDVAPCDFWLFPKLKSRLKGKIFQTTDEIQENMIGQLMAIGRIVWGPKMPTLKRTEVSLFCVQCFLYLVSSSINVSIFHSTWLDTF